MFLLLILVLEIGLFVWNNKTIILLVLIGPMVCIYTVAGTSRKIFAEIDDRNKKDALMAQAKAEDTAEMEAGKEAADKDKADDTDADVKNKDEDEKDVKE